MVWKEQRLTRRKEFQVLNREGKSWASQLLVLKIRPNNLGINRYGFSVSKRIGKAVCRNRVKRRLREIVRRTILKQGWDILIIARAGVGTSSFRQIENTAVHLLMQAKLLRSRD